MPPASGRPAAHVGAGILLSRLLGLIRERVFAHYFGNGMEADAFRAALRIPNVIRNLLGEGTLSASFIPVYAGMIEQGKHEDARRLSGVIASLLVLLAATAALLGIVLAPAITDFAAPGFAGRQRELTVTLVRIMFPMAGVMILSAWCLGVLNTHRRFFLSYAAPAMWNIAQIATLLAAGGVLMGASLSIALAWGALAGSVLQIGVQLPEVLRLVQRMHWGVSLETTGVRRVLGAWVPVVIGGGVAQISSIIDIQLASLLGQGSVSILSYAQLIAILPVSLFGVSVAAVALPELSREAASGETEELRRRVANGMRRIGYFIIPSAVAFVVLGGPIVGFLFQTGAFAADDTALVASVLAAYGLAVPAQATIKLLASGHYALGDTRTPVRIAVLAVATSAGTAFILMQRFGPVGIALGAAAGSYLNVVLNGYLLRRRLGGFFGRVGLGLQLKSAASAALAGVVGYIVMTALAGAAVWLVALGAAGAFSVVYGGITLALGHPDARAVAVMFRRESR